MIRKQFDGERGNFATSSSEGFLQRVLHRVGCTVSGGAEAFGGAAAAARTPPWDGVKLTPPARFARAGALSRGRTRGGCTDARERGALRVDECTAHHRGGAHGEDRRSTRTPDDRQARGARFTP